MHHDSGLTRGRAGKLTPSDFIQGNFTGLRAFRDPTAHLTGDMAFGAVSALNLMSLITNGRTAAAQVKHTSLQAIILNAIGDGLAILNRGHVPAIRRASHGGAVD